MSLRKNYFDTALCLSLATMMLVSTSSTTLANADVVEPFIETNWGQSGGFNPNFTYNNKTPFVGVTGTKRAPVGCIAAALGQVLNYYQYPKRGTGHASYCNSGGSVMSCDVPIEASFYQEKYDWEAMPNALNSLSSSESIEAVSTLLYHIGASVNVKYGETGSAAKLQNPSIIRQFKMHFGMPSITRVSRHDYSEAEWSEMMITEIKNGRPVVMIGMNPSQGGAGHAYILDGLNSDGQVHVNWGWGGHANGYYNLITLNSPFGAFTDDLVALINITPNDRSEGQSCNGSKGTQCEDGLRCMSEQTGLQITDFSISDENGVCMIGSDDIAHPPTIETETHNIGGSVEKSEWGHLGAFSTDQGISITMTGTADADLYVRKSQQATDDSWDCRPYRTGSAEKCSLDGNGDYHVSVKGYDDSSEFDLVITTQQFASDDTDVEDN